LSSDSRSKVIWSKDEVDILKEKYMVSDAETLRKMFPNRTIDAIRKKARKYGLYVPKELEFINRSNVRRGELSANWKGGFRRSRKGYRQILMPSHRRADSSGYVMEHIAVWERETGLEIPENCVIHHLNGVKDDNRIENLSLMERGAHTILHHTGTHLSEETKSKISNRRKTHC
jgi:hypothetical protein